MPTAISLQSSFPIRRIKQKCVECSSVVTISDIRSLIIDGLNGYLRLARIQRKQRVEVGQDLPL
jgi:hypothetical protein